MTDDRRSAAPRSTNRRAQEGQGLAEYAVLLALLACVSIAALFTLGGGVTRAFSDVGTAMAAAGGASNASGAAPAAQQPAAPAAQQPAAPAAQQPEPTKKPQPTKKP